jgi:WD40 repeat protein
MGEVIVLDTGTRRVLDYHSQLRSPVRSVALSACGKFLAWGGEDRIIQIWDLERYQGVQTLAFNSTPRLLAFSPDRRLLASAHADNVIRIWEVQPRQAELVITAPGSVNNVVFSPVDEQLAAGCVPTTITPFTPRPILKVWAVPSAQEVHTLTLKKGGMYHRLAYSPDGRWLSDGTRVIEVATGKESARLGTSLPNITARV